MKKYEKPAGIITNLHAKLDEAIAMRVNLSSALKPAFESGGSYSFEKPSNINYDRFTKIAVS